MKTCFLILLRQYLLQAKSRRLHAHSALEAAEQRGGQRPVHGSEAGGERPGPQMPPGKHRRPRGPAAQGSPASGEDARRSRRQCRKTHVPRRCPPATQLCPVVTC